MKIDINLLDEEMDHESKRLAESLIMDLVQPTIIQGELGLYNGTIHIEMSNGDNIDFEYFSPYAMGHGSAFFKLRFNNSEFVQINPNDEDLDDSPWFYIRKAYMQYLKFVITHKSIPKSIVVTKKASLGELELAFS